MKRFSNILVLVDDESRSEALLERARRMAQVTGAALTLIDVIDSSPTTLSRVIGSVRELRVQNLESDIAACHQERLDELAAPLLAGGLPVETKVLFGVGFIETIQHVLRHGNDLVMKAAHGTPGLSILAGPDLHLLRNCPCPVWILNDTNGASSRRIMAAVEPDPEDDIRDQLCHSVMEVAAFLSNQDAAKLDVVTAWSLPEETMLRGARFNMSRDEIEAILRTVELESSSRLQALVRDFEAFSDRIRVVHMKGVPADVVAEHAETEQIDTLVIGILGKPNDAGLLIGNTAVTIMNRVRCSILAVKPPGFVSPVTLERLAAS
ncbi:universal stress protein [Ovoidimarina sediminis]|uniref:universal stress protein n=1 Tax=Ovoidimarina sediminis TaxID=3079856 RepID=UPI00290C6C4D|nr:universal stress protein [Rhodophyticola sp. MJ-SS7]MDU8944826.1 universal stress protein [Rhodophyticola sp. MJ-SS7]